MLMKWKDLAYIRYGVEIQDFNAAFVQHNLDEMQQVQESLEQTDNDLPQELSSLFQQENMDMSNRLDDSI